MWHTYVGTMEYYSTFLKKGNPVIGYNMHEPCRRYTKWNKPGTKRQTWFHSYEVSKAVIHIEIGEWCAVFNASSYPLWVTHIRHITLSLNLYNSHIELINVLNGLDSVVTIDRA